MRLLLIIFRGTTFRISSSEIVSPHKYELLDRRTLYIKPFLSKPGEIMVNVSV